MSDQRITATEIERRWAELRKEREQIEREWMAQLERLILARLNEKPAPQPTDK